MVLCYVPETLDEPGYKNYTSHTVVHTHLCPSVFYQYSPNVSLQTSFERMFVQFQKQLVLL